MASGKENTPEPHLTCATKGGGGHQVHSSIGSRLFPNRPRR